MNQPEQQPPMPYGVQQPAPVYVPTAKQPGSATCKVWGILLIVFGLFSLLSLLASLAVFFGGFTGSSFAVGVDEEARRQIDQFTEDMTTNMLGRWSFWVNNVGEVVIVGLSLVAGFLLALKPRPIGRKLAIARALLVLVLVPVVAYESVIVIEDQFALQERMMRATLEGQPSTPGVSPDEVLEEMQPLVRGITYGGVIFTVVVILAINLLLLYFMTRPAVQEYLKNAAEGRTGGIPQYDPAMGIMHPPPQQAQPPPDGNEQNP